ncbi:MAG: NCS1 family nucleobase:cation symporter-1 [Bacteroidia bacterium]|jgi:NCS1 family nucleobase:cation symporter-1
MLNNPDPTLINDDLAPTSPENRNWSVLHMASLWIGMVVCVPTYMLAGGLIALGMNWWQAVGTVLLGNVVVLVPMILNGHAGTKLGVPFPVLSRASFGIRGANIPSVLRGLVACGWFGIQTAIGGSAIYQLAGALMGEPLGGADIAWLHLNPSELVCFLAFLGFQLVIIYRGIDSIKLLETWAAPFLILMGLALLAWAYNKADGFGNMLSAKSAFDVGGEKEGQFLAHFFPALTGMVGFWATLSLNIPDFTRYAKSQKDQALGQAIGLPLFMTLFAFIGVAVTSASVKIYGEAIPDPTELAGRMGGGFGVALALAALTIATLSTNIAANVVSPANAIMNLSPQKATFRIGGFITAFIGVAIMPWRLIESTDGYIFTWLIGYSALLGPIGGILIADYFLVRRTNIDVNALFRRDGEYWYSSGFNWTAIAALVIGILPNVPGFLYQAGFIESTPNVFQTIYTYAWFVGFLLSAGIYTLLMPKPS